VPYVDELLYKPTHVIDRKDIEHLILGYPEAA
jgi:hypothetical protein